MKQPLRFAPRRRVVAAACLLASPALALNTSSIIASTLSTDCLDYKVVGLCFWLYCDPYGCMVRTSPKVRHYVPDAVVSAYANTGENPWVEVQAMSQPNSEAQGGADGTTNARRENNLAKFKNADVIGHPGGSVLARFASSGYLCKGAGTAFMPYLLSTLDVIAWRYSIPESFYPESMIPLLREISSISQGTWGNVYPRAGFLHQVDDYKSGAVIAQRAGDIVTRKYQIHVYQPLLAKASNHYWPAGELKEGDASTGKWQELTPTLSNQCAVFPHSDAQVQAQKGDYAWALWRPYSCCESKGQIFLSSVDFQ
jgi:integrating conjugative element protein (TIGR03756 family)